MEKRGTRLLCGSGRIGWEKKTARSGATAPKGEKSGEESAAHRLLFARRRGDVFLSAVFFSLVIFLAALAARGGITAAGEGEMARAASAARESLADSRAAAALLGGGEEALAVAAQPQEEAEPVFAVFGVSDAEEYLAALEAREEALVCMLPVEAKVISGFSYRQNPLWDGVSENRYEFHGGYDLPVVTGTEARAFADGRVRTAGVSDTYGTYLLIDHEGGLTSLYAHLSAVLVRAGEKVKMGDPVALTGASGRVTGAHLHFELRRDGEPVDPALYLGR
ncbi:MAG: M23 family metallopeptidase [Clostridia bacterium]|nr:M23 family metallopeptidase [Clostridia bacterium]